MAADAASHAPTPRLATTRPTLSSDDAQATAQTHLSSQGIQSKASTRKQAHLPAPLAERHPENASRLVIYAPDQGTSRLAYEVRTVTGFFQSHLTLVDATSGEVLTSFAEQCTLHGGIHDEVTPRANAPSKLQGTREPIRMNPPWATRPHRLPARSLTQAAQTSRARRGRFGPTRAVTGSTDSSRTSITSRRHHPLFRQKGIARLEAA